MVVIDATMLMPLIRPDIAVPVDTQGVPIDRAKERIAHLVKQLEKDKTIIVVPTPALSEVLVRAGSEASQRIVDEIEKAAVFRIEPFDKRAAMEVAAMTRQLLNSRERKRGTSNASWTKIKFDRQIVAIAKVCGATEIYSDDEDVRKIAKRENIKVIGIADLPLPPEDPQLGLNLIGTAQGQQTGDDLDRAQETPPQQ